MNERAKLRCEEGEASTRSGSTTRSTVSGDCAEAAARRIERGVGGRVVCRWECCAELEAGWRAIHSVALGVRASREAAGARKACCSASEGEERRATELGEKRVDGGALERERGGETVRLDGPRGVDGLKKSHGGV